MLVAICVQVLIWSSVFVMPWIVREFESARPHWAWLALTLALQAATVYYYYAATWRSPGHVPAGWTAATRDGRHCRHCRADKPPRAHHCATCGRCILVRDHHCIWTNNCVGLHNRDVFMGFILSASASMSAALAWNVALFSARVPSQWLTWFLGVHTLVLVGTVLLVGNLSIFQIFMCRLYNLTTMDYYLMERRNATHTWVGPVQVTGLEENTFTINGSSDA